MTVPRVFATRRKYLLPVRNFGYDRKMPGFHGGRPNGAVDWLDACNERRLSSLVDLDDESATLDYRWRASPCADFRIGSVLATQLVHADRGLRGRCIVPKRSCCRLKFVMIVAVLEA